ncbi:uncharacterized protein isoform X3 [Salmo salar]|uniref:Uncharacterized protein isoform X3 n=1 Tax=Salmo salar TaxID=8030 RepID=A0ABM3E9L7_SALSA|nr:uncharacterized protein LOC106597706 isoform X3 [Salmo salar]
MGQLLIPDLMVYYYNTEYSCLSLSTVKLKREVKRDALFVDRHKDYLIQNVTTVIPTAFYLIHSKMYSKIRAARTSQEQMRLLYEALDSGRDKIKSTFYRILLDLEPHLVKDLGAKFVDDHKDQLIQMVTKVMPIFNELFYEEVWYNIRVNQMNSQDQMKLLFQALEEAGDTRTEKVKSDFYRNLLDLEPDLVIDLEKDRRGKEELRKEKEELRKEKDELKEELRKAKEIIQSLSTSPGGQQKTQTPSQKSEGIEGVEMESLPGRKSAPEMKPLLAAGPQKDDLDDLERGGRVTTEFNYRETIPSGRKSAPEMKPLLAAGPQKDDLDDLERGGRVTTEFNYVL